MKIRYALLLIPVAVGGLAACGTATHSTAPAPKTSVSQSAVPTGDLQTEVMIHEQGLTVTWNMPASVMAGTQITGASLSNTTDGPDMYALEMTTPGAAATLAAQMQQYAGPFTDANGNDVGSVSIQTFGSGITVSTDSTPAMTDFLHGLKIGASS